MALHGINQSQLERGDWRVFVNPRPGDWNVDVWLINRQGADTYNASVEKGTITLTKLKEGASPENPFLRIHQDVWQLLIDAMAENTPPTKKERVEAELEATKYHLEDMRQLVLGGKHKRGRKL